MKEKSYVEDIDRSVYDFKDDEKDAYKLQAGLTPEIVEKLSKKPFFLYPLSTPHNIPISIEKKAAGKVICKDTPIFENIRELIVASFLYE